MLAHFRHHGSQQYDDRCRSDGPRTHPNRARNRRRNTRNHPLDRDQFQLRLVPKRGPTSPSRLIVMLVHLRDALPRRNPIVFKQFASTWFLVFTGVFLGVQEQCELSIPVGKHQVITQRLTRFVDSVAAWKRKFREGFR